MLVAAPRTAVEPAQRVGNMVQTPVQYIKANMNKLISALPGSASARKRFAQAAIGVAMSPAISGCTPESVIKAIYACARLNLIPDPVLHHAAVVPFRNHGVKEATLIIEFRGLVELMKRANPALSIKAGTVYKNDTYTLIEGTSDDLRITRRWWEKEGESGPGPAILFYAVVREPGAEPVIVTLSAIEAKEIGMASKAGMKPGTPWYEHFDRMGEKTTIRRIERFVRMDPDKEETRQFREAIEIDERTDELPPVVDDSDLFGDFVSSPASPPEGRRRVGNLGEALEGAPGSGQGRSPGTPTQAAQEPTQKPETPPDDDGPPTKADVALLKQVVDMALSDARLPVNNANRHHVLASVLDGRDPIEATKTGNHGNFRAWISAGKELCADADKVREVCSNAAAAEGANP